jgi:TPR repeat protein
MVVVGHDCDRLVLLPECHVRGTYSFVAHAAKQEKVRLQGAEDYRINLPASAEQLAKFRGDLQLELVSVGVWRATSPGAASGQLQGSCQGATHVVRGVVLGTFGVPAGTRVKLYSAGKGELDVCRKAGAEAAAPQEMCNVPLRLELARLREGSTLPLAERAVPEKPTVCPLGFVRAENKCVRAGTVQTYQCAPLDVSGCKRQCDNGEFDSCTRLAGLYVEGKGVSKDPVEAARLFEAACEGGDPLACSHLGIMCAEGVGISTDLDQAVSLLRVACDLGNASACTRLGVMYLQGTGVSKDNDWASYLLRRGCDAGEPKGCANLAMMLRDGEGNPRNHPVPEQLLARACDGGSAVSCAELADMAQTRQQQCDAGKLDVCGQLGTMYLEGVGVERDAKRAILLMERGCAGSEPFSCGSLGILYASGGPVARNVRRAVPLLEMACERDFAEACAYLGFLYEGDDNRPEDSRAVQTYQKACTLGAEAGCEAVRRLEE